MLSNHKKELIRLLREGKTRKEIAKEIGLKPSTVRIYVSILYSIHPEMKKIAANARKARTETKHLFWRGKIIPDAETVKRRGNVKHFILQGLNSKQIADRLGIPMYLVLKDIDYWKKKGLEIPQQLTLYKNYKIKNRRDKIYAMAKEEGRIRTFEIIKELGISTATLYGDIKQLKKTYPADKDWFKPDYTVKSPKKGDLKEVIRYCIESKIAKDLIRTYIIYNRPDLPIDSTELLRVYYNLRSLKRRKVCSVI